MKKEFKTDFEIFKNIIKHNKYTKTTLKNKLNESFENAEMTEDEKLELDILIEKYGLDEEQEKKTIQEQLEEMHQGLEKANKAIEDLLINQI